MKIHAPRSALRRLVALATLLAALVGARGARATTILPLDLDALTGAAGRIFRGRVVAVRSGRDARGLPATWTTFAVDESLKGAVPATLEIKQLGSDAPLADGTLLRIPALPSYRVGDEVVLFLHPESSAGFTSPVGLGQGRFRVRYEHGRPVAENDVGNANLRAPRPAAPPAGARALTAAASLPASAAIPVDDLLTRVRALSGAR